MKNLATPVFHSPRRLVVSCACFLSLVGCSAAGSESPKTNPSAETPANPRSYGDWESASFGGGGYMQNVVVCPTVPDRLYAYVDVGGVYRSDDGGKSWRMMHGGLPGGDGYYSVRGLWVSPQDPQRVVIAVGNQWTRNHGLFLSRDGGITWEKRSDAPFLGNEQHRSCGTILAQLPDGSLLAGSAGGGVLTSGDGGETWTTAGLEGANITDLKVASDGTVYACALPHTMPDRREIGGGFFRKAPGGDWEALPAGPEEIVFAPDGALIGLFDSAKVRRSTDGGSTWSDFSEGLPEVPGDRGYTSESRFRALAAGPNFLLIGSSRGTVYRRNANADAWQPVAREGVTEEFEGRPWWGRMRDGAWQHYGAAMGSLVIDPANPDRWWFTDWYGIYETRDAGANWTLRIDGIEVTVIHAITQDPLDAGRVHAGMADNGYVGSLDGGRTYGSEKFTSNMKALALDSSLPGRVYGTGSRGGEWRADHLWVSADGGSTWVLAPMQGLPPANERWMNSVAVRAGHPYEVAVALAGPIGNGGGVWRSIDGGRTFQPLLEGMEKAGDFFHREIWGRVAELAWGPDGTMVAASHGTGRVFTKTGNAPWLETGRDLPGKPFQVRLQDGKFYMTRGQGGVWRSSDGVSWEQISAQPAEILAVDAAEPGRLAVAVDGKISLTEDGGANWRSLECPPMGQISALAFAGQRLLAGTKGGGFFLSPLGDKANADVAAGPTRPGVLPVVEETEVSLPVPSSNWSKPWTKSGSLVTERAEGLAGVVLRSDGAGASGSTGIVFPATGSPFRMTGRWQVTGEGAVAKLAARAFDGAGQQIGWFPLAENADVGAGKPFDRQVELPPQAQRGEIVLLFEGDGSVELAELEFSRADPLFGHPVASEKQTPSVNTP